MIIEATGDVSYVGMLVGLGTYCAKFISQFSRSVAQSCPALCGTMDCSSPGLPVHHQLPEFTQTHVHRVGDAVQPSHPSSVVPFSSAQCRSSQNPALRQWRKNSFELSSKQLWCSRRLESPLDCKGIKPVSPRGNQP